MRLAVISNVNMDYVGRLLKKDYEVWTPEGYGTALEEMLNDNSSFNCFSPEAVAILTDVDSLVAGSKSVQEMDNSIRQWYTYLESGIKPHIQYFLADTLCHFPSIADNDEADDALLEISNLHCILALCQKYANVHRIKLRAALEKAGVERCFSPQLWYIGKVPFTTAGCKIAADAINRTIKLIYQTPKKVLALDLDNTLWGGVLGEAGLDGLALSDDGDGAIYRDIQRLVRKMREHGVILVIISKNNRLDVDEMFEKHRHMVLQYSDFAAIRINWEPKPENILSLSKELNLGLDSFVFVDDMPVERASVKAMFPMVTVPDFPTELEKLPVFFEEIYCTYFQKLRMTTEDTHKTEQYLQNRQREELASKMDYDAFLRSLEIEVEAVTLESDGTWERVYQIFQKTNQFNTTTIRYTREELREIGELGKVYAFRAKDKYGDYGIIAAITVSFSNGIPCIEDFAMSCRIMGKRVENYLLMYVERNLRVIGYRSLKACYVESEKNMPVKTLYPCLGYECVENNGKKRLYELDLLTEHERIYYVKEM